MHQRTGLDDYVGAGIMTAGQMLHAGNHSVVEIGHIQIDPNGELLIELMQG
ncbi:hypothetical protein PSI23_12280 [Xenorhabdus sp. XENO-10]|uniref:Uncharacterized protein n=1 Tax=Xenorhabdus yunnanensis TaxID=3025878 RepID=A0ABT5LG45_9GAMM|nr:hypothetical protein [Xenorhabdus yunnanensis]MDC9590059.1 hypothetical protein [Xenorhabdus yunnanensis]